MPLRESYCSRTVSLQTSNALRDGSIFVPPHPKCFAQPTPPNTFHDRNASMMPWFFDCPQCLTNTDPTALAAAAAAASAAPRRAAPTTEMASTAARGMVTTTAQSGRALGVCAGGDRRIPMANICATTKKRCPQSTTPPSPPNPRLRRCRGRRKLYGSQARGGEPRWGRRGGRVG